MFEYCITVKVINFHRHWKYCCNHLKIGTKVPYSREMHPNDADEMANSEDPDQTAPVGAV